MQNKNMDPVEDLKLMSKASQYVVDALRTIGINADGSNPCDMRICEIKTIDRALAQGSLGLGEEYMAGGWDAQALDEFFFLLLRSNVLDKLNPATLLFHTFSARYLNRQNRSRAWEVGEKHYDLGNDFYESMLDSKMTYTCGYWKGANNLEEAQFAKLDLICRKLQLEPGMRILDIGCGWGSLMAHAATHYGVTCVGVTISKEQTDWGRRMYAGLPIEFRLQDYRDCDGKFDSIVSVGMFEHVGRRNHREYMEIVSNCLSDEGLFLLHTIGKNQRQSVPDPWIDKYIFPNGDLPSIGQIGDAVDGLFVVEDLHNFGADYDKTLTAWHANFEKSWPRFATAFGPYFYRMWKYYLLSCAGAFRARDIQLWQWVLSKKGVLGGYESVR